MNLQNNVVAYINHFITDLKISDRNVFSNFLDFDGDMITSRNDPRYWTYVYCTLFNINHGFTVLTLSSSLFPNKNSLINKIKIEV